MMLNIQHNALNTVRYHYARWGGMGHDGWMAPFPQLHVTTVFTVTFIVVA